MHKPQPSTYTEFAGDDEGPSIQIPVARNCCDLCVHREPFGDAVFVVWCSLHGGHVPCGATCAAHELAPYDPS